MTTKPKHLLPIGIQTFSEIREDGYLYVDKTRPIHELITTGKTYFLSRPRRFGKSLLISTLEAIFQGRKELFEGLDITRTDYDWPIHPVVRLDFSSMSKETPQNLEKSLRKRLVDIAKTHDLALSPDLLIADAFQDLLQALSNINRVVVLIDEYDAPIIGHIGKNNDMAIRNREFLKQFYTVIKGQDQYLKFVFLTGVSKFSKVGVFSGLNNLQDITMDGRFADLIGWTQEELETNFGDEIQALAQREEETEQQTLQKIKLWYNGYRFSDREINVYNPFSTLLLFAQKAFKFHWFETGTPAFLVELMKKQDEVALQELIRQDLSSEAFSCYEIETLDPLPLLLQTGYLTIQTARKTEGETLYTLDYPNFEVKRAFSMNLLGGYSEINNALAGSYIQKLLSALRLAELDDFFETLRIFFANIPCDIRIAKEKYYQTIFYLIFTLLGLRVEAETRTNRGRIDAVVELDKAIWLFEFKLTGTAEEALAQIKDKGYYEKYLGRGKALHLVGAAFDSEKRNLGEFLHERK